MCKIIRKNIYVLNNYNNFDCTIDYLGYDNNNDLSHFPTTDYLILNVTYVVFDPYSPGIDFRRQNLTSVDI